MTYWERIMRIYYVAGFVWKHFEELKEIMHYGHLNDKHIPPAQSRADWTDPDHSEPSGIILTLIVGVLIVLTLGALILSSVQAQTTQPKPDPRFVAISDVPVVSVFGDTFPAVTAGQIVVQRHLYVAAIDPDKRQPVWIAYVVDRKHWDTDNVLSRNFHTPKKLQPVALEQSDYANSGYELGHLYGLQFVSAEPHASEVNEVEVIAAQRPELNKGPWLAAETRIKKASEKQPVQVIAGLMWHSKMPPLANADEPHAVASHCWLIFMPGPDGTEEAYKFPQSVQRSDELKQFAIKPEHLRDEISSLWTHSI